MLFVNYAYWDDLTQREKSLNYSIFCETNDLSYFNSFLLLQYSYENMYQYLKSSHNNLSKRPNHILRKLIEGFKTFLTL